MNKRLFQTTLMLLAGASVWTSCIKDEALNMECDMLSAWVEGEAYAVNFDNPNQMRIKEINSTEKDIRFTVRSMYSLPKEMPVYFELTPGATISPASGSKQDFTAGPVTYTVTSEDGAWKREYKVSFNEPVLPTFKFSFDNVGEETAMYKSYHVFYEMINGTRQDIWATGNRAASLAMASNATAEDFPSSSLAEGYKGKGVRLTTIDAGNIAKMLKKPIAAGNLFLGKFNADLAMASSLKSTQFGITIDQEPVRVTGYYKYTPGKDFTDMNSAIVAGRTDEASIYAIFYKNQNGGGKEYLNGEDVQDWEKLKANPIVCKVAKVAQLPPTEKWTRFEMFFEGKDAENADVVAKKYNFSLVFSSSKDGALFEGAIGSTLCIDEVEVSFEKIDQPQK